MADLEELAGRVEGLSGPDREVDCLIAELLDPERTAERRVTYYGEPTGEHVLSDGLWSKCKSFTASIDAAMTLVPEGYDWSVNSEQGRGVAYTIDRSSEFSDDTTAETPALALVSAALRARARTQGNPNG